MCCYPAYLEPWPGFKGGDRKPDWRPSLVCCALQINRSVPFRFGGLIGIVAQPQMARCDQAMYAFFSNSKGRSRLPPGARTSQDTTRIEPEGWGSNSGSGLRYSAACGALSDWS